MGPARAAFRRTTPDHRPCVPGLRSDNNLTGVCLEGEKTRVMARSVLRSLARRLGAACVAAAALLAASTTLADEKAPVAARPAELPVKLSAAPGKGFTISTLDDRFAIGMRGRIQIRNTFTHTDEADSNEINLKTVRLFLSGHLLTPQLTYTVQLAFGGGDFEKDSATPLFDAFVDYTRFRDLNLRVGQFFVPFDRARTTRELALQLVDRQQVVQELTLDRDVGAMLSSNDLLGTRGILSYNLFVGGGEGRNRFGAQAMGPLTVLRLAVRPFGPFDDDREGDLERLPRPRLAVGFAGAYNLQTNRQKSTYGTTTTLGTFDYLHGAADLVFKLGGFSLLAEAVVRKATRPVLTGVANGDVVQEWSRSGWGYFVQGGFMVHEKVEIAARWDSLHAFAGTDPAFVKLADEQGNQVGAGLNLYLNGHALKLQADYARFFGDASPKARDVARLQLDATF